MDMSSDEGGVDFADEMHTDSDESLIDSGILPHTGAAAAAAATAGGGGFVASGSRGDTADEANAGSATFRRAVAESTGRASMKDPVEESVRQQLETMLADAPGCLLKPKWWHNSVRSVAGHMKKRWTGDTSSLDVVMANTEIFASNVERIEFRFRCRFWKYPRNWKGGPVTFFLQLGFFHFHACEMSFEGAEQRLRLANRAFKEVRHRVLGDMLPRDFAMNAAQGQSDPFKLARQQVATLSNAQVQIDDQLKKVVEWIQIGDTEKLEPFLGEKYRHARMVLDASFLSTPPQSGDESESDAEAKMQHRIMRRQCREKAEAIMSQNNAMCAQNAGALQECLQAVDDARRQQKAAAEKKAARDGKRTRLIDCGNVSIHESEISRASSRRWSVKVNARRHEDHEREKQCIIQQSLASLREQRIRTGRQMEGTYRTLVVFRHAPKAAERLARMVTLFSKTSMVVKIEDFDEQTLKHTIRQVILECCSMVCL